MDAARVAMFTKTMVTTPAFVLTAVVVFGLGSCLYYRKQHRTKQMRAKAPPEIIEPDEHDEHLDDAGSHLALAVQGTQDGLWYWDLKGKTFQFSSYWETLFDYEPGELSKDADEWFSRVHPAYLAELQARITAHLQGESEQFRYEHRMRRKEGRIFGFRLALQPFATARARPWDWLDRTVTLPPSLPWSGNCLTMPSMTSLPAYPIATFSWAAWIRPSNKNGSRGKRLICSP